MPNGAQALLQTMLSAGVDTCFTNPGTSEMHFVAALDDAPNMRAVLALFEGVATGAADGYARMADKPAAILLHLGCGLGNGLANLHNARKARVPVMNIVGDHARYHVPYDALLQSDIETVAKNVSPWVRTSESTKDLCTDALEALDNAQALPASVSTLVLPADVSWSDGGVPATPKPVEAPNPAKDEIVSSIADLLKQDSKTAIVLGGKALREEALLLAAGISEATESKLFAESFPARMTCGGGLPKIERIDYAVESLAGFDNVVLVDVPEESISGSTDSIGGPNSLNRLTLASISEDALASLRKLANVLNVKALDNAIQPEKTERPSGDLTIDSACQAIAAALPQQAIVADESNINAAKLAQYMSKAAKHDLLTLTGGGIGQSLSASIGAAIASPKSTVLVLVDAENAMTTIQSLWTIARENLNVQVIVLSSRSSAKRAASANTDFATLSGGMGVPGLKISTLDELNSALEKLGKTKTPSLIELELP